MGHWMTTNCRLTTKITDTNWITFVDEIIAIYHNERNVFELRVKTDVLSSLCVSHFFLPCSKIPHVCVCMLKRNRVQFIIETYYKVMFYDRYIDDSFRSNPVNYHITEINKSHLTRSEPCVHCSLLIRALVCCFVDVFPPFAYIISHFI